MTNSTPDITRELVALVREGHLAAFIDRAWNLPVADFADVLAALPAADRSRLIAELPPQLTRRVAAAIARGSQPRTGTAGSLLTSHVVQVNAADTIALAVEAVRRQAAAIGDLTEIFVVDGARRLSGMLSVKQLLVSPPDALIRDVMHRNAMHVGPAEEQAVVARVIRRYTLTSVAVVDESGRLLGRVTADAVRDVAVDEAAEDLLHFAGVSSGETADATWSLAVRSRLPWLYANLAPAFGAAAVVFFFKGTLLRVVTLAVWLPVVAGVGGNAGTQALATAVRRLVLHPGRPEGLRSLIWREAAIGATNGLAIGVIVAGVAVLLGESWRLGLIVSVAMTANLALAGVAGAAIPTVLKRIGRDPALASPVIVTALMDACGFALLLGLASRALP